MTQRLSIRAYARHRGVSHTAVRKAFAAGRIATAADGMIDRDAADRAWRANSDPARVMADAPRVERVARVPAATPDPETAATFQTARLANERLRVRERQLNLTELESRLVDRAAEGLAVGPRPLVLHSGEFPVKVYNLGRL